MSPEQIEQLKRLHDTIINKLQQTLNTDKRSPDIITQALKLTTLYSLFARGVATKQKNSMWTVRELYTKDISWVLVDKGLIEWIVRIFKNIGSNSILEIGAGNGFLGGLLRHALPETDINLTDPFLSHFTRAIKTYSKVDVLTAEEAVCKYYDCEGGIKNMILLISWPCQTVPYAYNAIIKFKELGGKYVIYIGTDKGGCTGTDKFHDELKKNWECNNVYQQPQWVVCNRLEDNFKVDDFARFYKLHSK